MNSSLSTSITNIYITAVILLTINFVTTTTTAYIFYVLLLPSFINSQKKNYISSPYIFKHTLLKRHNTQYKKKIQFLFIDFIITEQKEIHWKQQIKRLSYLLRGKSQPEAKMYS